METTTTGKTYEHIGTVIGIAYEPVEYWQANRHARAKYSVAPNQVQEITPLISSQTTAAISGFFDKPANIAIVSVAATLLLIGAFNWKKIAKYVSR